jgi:hypothetical protein
VEDSKAEGRGRHFLVRTDRRSTIKKRRSRRGRRPKGRHKGIAYDDCPETQNKLPMSLNDSL